jgi:Na+-transporting NADH:ubiquinone oxidoreductase subunit C
MHNRVSYIIMFATAVCVVCAVLVASAAVGLKDRQLANQALDKQKNVLYAAGLASPSDPLTSDDIQRLFENVRAVVVDIQTDEVVEDAPINIDTFSVAKAAGSPDLGFAAPQNNAGISRLSKYQVVYHVLDDSGSIQMVVIPIKGYGLWSTLYGFLALDSDTTTIRGITYYDQKETPGLGGEVENPRWKAAWSGRLAYDENWEPAITVIKGQAGPASSDPYRVDGLSGATITSRGVSNMMKFWLGDDGMGPYLKGFRERQKG